VKNFRFIPSETIFLRDTPRPPCPCSRDYATTHTRKNCYKDQNIFGVPNSGISPPSSCFPPAFFYNAREKRKKEKMLFFSLLLRCSRKERTLGACQPPGAIAHGGRCKAWVQIPRSVKGFTSWLRQPLTGYRAGNAIRARKETVKKRPGRIPAQRSRLYCFLPLQIG